MAVFKLSPARERKRCRTDLVSDSETEAVSEEEGKRPAMEVDSQLAVRSQMRDTMEDTQPQTSGGGMSVVSIDEADAMRAKISALSADCAELEAKVSTNHIRFLIHNQQQQQQQPQNCSKRLLVFLKLLLLVCCLAGGGTTSASLTMIGLFCLTCKT